MDEARWVAIKGFIDRWRNMMNRCYNPDCAAYKNYGGRGIKVCDEWHNPYTYIADLPQGFFVGAHLDRIENDADYEPTNVRWVTARENHQNRRTSIPLTFRGRTQTLSAWARELGVTRAMLDGRLRDGWPIEKAFTTPSIGVHERMKIARDTRLNRIKRERGQPEGEPFVTKRSLIPKRVYLTVEYRGETLTLVELAKRTGIPRDKLSKRIVERGWDVERAVAAGLNPKRK